MFATQNGDAALFHNRSDCAMTRAGFEYILTKHVATAAQAEPSVAEKHITPHVLRHSCAMHTLQATGDVRKVSLWLGHTNLQSTEIYLRADPTEKLEMLAGAEIPALRPGRFRAPDMYPAFAEIALQDRLRPQYPQSNSLFFVLQMP